MAFEIEFYKTKDGKEPVVDFLDSLDDKMAAKLVGLMEVLEEKGTELRMPYSEYLDDGIFELRCKQGSNITIVRQIKRGSIRHLIRGRSAACVDRHRTLYNAFSADYS